MKVYVNIDEINCYKIQIFRKFCGNVMWFVDNLSMELFHRLLLKKARFDWNLVARKHYILLCFMLRLFCIIVCVCFIFLKNNEVYVTACYATINYLVMPLKRDLDEILWTRGTTFYVTTRLQERDVFLQLSKRQTQS